jgi:hypothetical protein
MVHAAICRVCDKLQPHHLSAHSLETILQRQFYSHQSHQKKKSMNFIFVLQTHSQGCSSLFSFLCWNWRVSERLPILGVATGLSLAIQLNTPIKETSTAEW